MTISILPVSKLLCNEYLRYVNMHWYDAPYPKNCIFNTEISLLFFLRILGLMPCKQDYIASCWSYSETFPQYSGKTLHIIPTFSHQEGL